MEQIRVIRELRNADRKRGRAGEFVRPRFMFWENVPGAFSSNGGRDFQTVLTECVRIAAPNAPDVPHPERWPLADAYFGSGWSVAYRVFDAQFWGVAQRRRRICLVADFGGFAAPEILFVRKGVSGDFTPCGTPGEGASGIVEKSTYPAIKRGPEIIVQAAQGFPLGFRPENVRCYDETATTLCNGTRPGFTCGVIQNGVNYQNTVRQGAVVRRLTPLECERLQGYPDGWTDIGDWTDDGGKVHKTSDSARYRALGNSIALPPWKWVLKRISAQYERDATLGSLFDGIGGFPLLWEQINGRGSALWASEIEEFPIAVTKRRFGNAE